MIKAVIFDCFGVLAEDGWLPFKRTYIGSNTVLAQQVADLGKQNEFGIISNEDYFRATAELIGVEQQLLKDAVGRRVPNTELFEYIATLKPAYKIGLLSNANYDVTAKLFAPSQAVCFDASVLSYESHLVKPDPRMYELIAARLGVEPDECVFIDDQDRYAEASEDVGMVGIVYASPAELIQRLSQILERE